MAREFGTRPVNFLLVIFLVIDIIIFFFREGKVTHAKGPAIFILIFAWAGVSNALSISWFGLPQKNLIEFIKQALTFSYGVLSIIAWNGLIRATGTDYIEYIRKVVVGITLVYIASYWLDYFSLISCHTAIVDALTLRQDCTRPSGLFSEPSYVGAWAAFALPYALLGIKRRKGIIASLSVATFIIGSALSSGSRTFAAISALQIIAFALPSRRIFILILISASLISPFFVLAVHGLTDYSAIDRSYATLAALNAALHHPFIGIGIGQFTNYFLQHHFSAQGIGSTEIATWLAGNNGERLSTFNIFTRVADEFGLLGLAIFLFVINFTLIKNRTFNPSWLVRFQYAQLAGGLGFWLTQDSYVYQPAIFSLAISLAIKNSGAIKVRTSQMIETKLAQRHTHPIDRTE